VLWKKYRKTLLDVAKEFSKTYPDKLKYEKPEKGINDLNKATNTSKLLRPFEELGIRLEREDYKVINTRNKFLHGEAPDITGAGEGRYLERLNADLQYCALRFYTLLSMIILKNAGYKGHVLNHTRFNEDSTGIRLNEQPYRRV
tara:strand:+ start:1096 stop:1527 length:432 start_codon:yes stop_codon:yes gene_type:complete